MKADLDRGLKPTEALQVIFTRQDQQKYNLRNRRSIARFIQKYIAARDLPYKVTSFEDRAAGSFVIMVQCPRR